MYPSYELCKELHDLSGWRGDEYLLEPIDGGKAYRMGHYYDAYSAGWLLSKLPRGCCVATCKDGGATASSDNALRYRNVTEQGDTVEDALCKLAIELFKLDILKKEL